MVVAWGRKSYLGPALKSHLCLPGIKPGLGTQTKSKFSYCCF